MSTENYEGMAEKVKKEKEKIIMLSVISNIVLVILKLVVGLLTGLVSVVAEALHSANDLLASLIAYFGVKGSLRPPDREHPYGHGKVEIITGWIENVLILIIGVGIVHEGYRKFMKGTHAEIIILGIIVMLISGVVNLFVSNYLIKKGKELRSVGIEVDGEHLRADVVTSFGIAGALIIMQFTKIWQIDPIGAIFVGVWVIGIFIRLSYKLTHQIIDKGLNENELIKIYEMLACFTEVRDYHKIRTRQSGSTIFVDMHVKVDRNMTVEASHELTKKIETKIAELYGEVNVLIHIEPFYKH